MVLPGQGASVEFDFRQLEVFCRIVELGSFSKAAVEVHLAQASVSERISNLEQQVGCRLLDPLGKATGEGDGADRGRAHVVRPCRGAVAPARSGGARDAEPRRGEARSPAYRVQQRARRGHPAAPAGAVPAERTGDRPSRDRGRHGTGGSPGRVRGRGGGIRRGSDAVAQHRVPASLVR
ncbi:MAG: LysR family transcriptional regulator [Deltaproteobacteria bacterium]|nr:LysR family transcriptional regulator [Deltaproteobacteria bacterium]